MTELTYEEKLRLEQEEAKERLLLLKMTEEEKKDYFREKEKRKKQIEEEKLRKKKKQDEKASHALNQVKKLIMEEENVKMKAEKRINFIRKLKSERAELSASQSLTRSFVYSYFKLLDAMAEKIQELEKKKSKEYIKKILEYKEPVFVIRSFASFYDKNNIP
jgi:hypothetical protein